MNYHRFKYQKADLFYLGLPGVYIFKSQSKKVLYVGRADNDLHKRVGQTLSEKKELKKNTAWIGYRYVKSPKEGYLLECERYHKYKPHHNKRHPEKLFNRWKCPVCKN